MLLRCLRSALHRLLTAAPLSYKIVLYSISRSAPPSEEVFKKLSEIVRNDGLSVLAEILHLTAVSYTHLTLPTKA